MQKAFKDIVERLEYLLNHFGEHCEEWGSDKEGDCHRKSCADCVLKHAIEIVNQATEEYKQEVCEWRLCDEEANVYDTTCRNLHILLEGSPIDNNYEFCPYCGKKIKVVE